MRQFLPSWSGDVGDAIGVLRVKPTHSINYFLAIIGFFSTGAVVSGVLLYIPPNDITFSDLTWWSLLFLMPATAVHITLIYDSLMKIECDKEFSGQFDGFINSWTDFLIRLFAFLFLVFFCGKIGFDSIFKVDEFYYIWIYAVTIMSVFLLLIAWSLLAKKYASKCPDVKHYLICDGLACFHWFTILMIIVFKESWILVPTILAAFFYLVAIFYYRFGEVGLRSSNMRHTLSAGALIVVLTVGGVYVIDPALREARLRASAVTQAPALGNEIENATRTETASPPSQ